MSIKTVFQLSSYTHNGIQKSIAQIERVRQVIPDLQVHLVLHGEAVKLLLLDNISDFFAKEIQIVACAHALRAWKIDENELNEKIMIVPSAIAHLIQRQAEGWTYIKMDS